MTIDVRTRTDGDIRAIEPDAFFSYELPVLLETTGRLAARGAAHLGLGPMTLRIEGEPFTLRPGRDTIAVAPGEAHDTSIVVEMSRKTFSDWAQDVKSLLTLFVTKDAQVISGEPNAALRWDAVLRAIVDNRAIYEPGSVTLTDRDGSPLDINKSFTVDDDDAEMGRFLEQTGFLMLRGWVAQDVVSTIYQDINRGLATAQRDDPHRWWAKLETGDDACVRLKHFCDISAAGKLAAESDLFKRICNLTGDAFAFPPACIEALIKPTGVLTGPSEIRWHKDCWQGRHAFFCSGLTIGMLCAPSNEQTGGFRIMAGSHRTNFAAIDRDIAAIDLPVRALYGEPGDLTVHLSCAMHETVPPQQGERRLMYSGFSLLDRVSGEGVDNRYSIKHAAWSEAVSSAWDVYA